MGFIGSTQLTDGSVTTPKLADDAVSYEKIDTKVKAMIIGGLE